jgi:hypothetical protein
MKYALNFEIIRAGEHCNITHTALEELICTGRIAERTNSSYMILESVILGPELLSSRFFSNALPYLPKCILASCLTHQLQDPINHNEPNEAILNPK